MKGTMLDTLIMAALKIVTRERHWTGKRAQSLREGVAHDFFIQPFKTEL